MTGNSFLEDYSTMDPQGSDSEDGDDRSQSPDEQPELQTQKTTGKLTRCAVCKELTDNHHIHYGALCCFSCRAFFRRANQRIKKASYICKQDNKCDVSFKNRKKCQKCRFEACLNAGMDPCLVLTDDQKKARFRKKSEKKMEIAQQQEHSDLRLVRHRESFPHMTQTQNRNQTESKKRRRTTDVLPLNFLGSPKAGDVFRTVRHIKKDPYEDFGLMFQQTGPYGGKLQNDTLKDLEETLALAQEIQTLSRGQESTLTLPSTDRHHHHSCGNPTEFRSSKSNQLGKKLSSSAPLFRTSWNTTTHSYQPQSTLLPLFPGNSLAPRNSPPTGDLDDEDDEDDLPTAEDLLNDPLLHPLGTAEPTGQTLSISPFCPSPLLNPSDLPSPISLSYSSSSVLNTPIPTPGSKTGQPLSNEPQPDPEIPDSNDSRIKKLMADFEEDVLPAEDLFRRLVSFHCGTIHMSDYDFGRVIFHIRERFRLFAVKQPEFQSLSVAEQCQILNANQPLFVHYILAKYFTASSGEDQIEWLMGPINRSTADPYWLRFMSSVELISAKVLTRDVGLFSETSALRKYTQKATERLSDSRLTPKHNGIVAALVLYSSLEDRRSSFQSCQSVSQHLSKLTNMIQSSSYEGIFGKGINNLVDYLKELKSIFLSQSSSSSNGSVRGYWGPLGGEAETTEMSKELAMPFTCEEEEWLGVQLSKYTSAYRDVPLGEDYVNEFIMFTFDVPLSKHFVYKGYSTFAERFRRVLKTQPGFNDLNDKDQALVWKQGCAKAVACCSAKQEHCPNGNDQLQFMFGELDRNNWKRNYETQIAVTKINKIKKVMMVDCNKVSATFNTQELLDYLRLVGTLGEVTSYNELFPVLTLIALLSGDNLTPEGARFATDTRNRYFTVLGRKLSGNQKAYSNICMGLNEIDELSELMKKLDTK